MPETQEKLLQEAQAAEASETEHIKQYQKYWDAGFISRFINRKLIKKHVDLANQYQKTSQVCRKKLMELGYAE